MNVRALLLRGDLRRLRLALLDLFSRGELPSEIQPDLDAAFTSWILGDPQEAVSLIRDAPSFETLALMRSLFLIERLGSEGAYESIWRSKTKSLGLLNAHNLAIRGLETRGMLDTELSAEFRRSFASRVVAVGYSDAFERALATASGK